MDEKKARQILQEWIRPDNTLFDLHQYLSWSVGSVDAVLDGPFSADELEAIAWWMRNTKKEGEEDGHHS